jgi:hypothetical protein
MIFKPCSLLPIKIPLFHTFYLRVSSSYFTQRTERIICVTLHWILKHILYFLVTNPANKNASNRLGTAANIMEPVNVHSHDWLSCSTAGVAALEAMTHRYLIRLLMPKAHGTDAYGTTSSDHCHTTKPVSYVTYAMTKKYYNSFSLSTSV